MPAQDIGPTWGNWADAAFGAESDTKSSVISRTDSQLEGVGVVVNARSPSQSCHPLARTAYGIVAPLTSSSRTSGWRWSPASHGGSSPELRLYKGLHHIQGLTRMPTPPAAGAFAPLRHPVFRALW